MLKKLRTKLLLMATLALVVSFVPGMSVRAENDNNYTDPETEIVYELNNDQTATIIYGREAKGVIEIPSSIKVNEVKYTVTTIGNNAFGGDIITDGCSETVTSNENLESVVIPESVSVIGNHAFSYCWTLKNVTIRGGATIGNNAFQDCEKLTDVSMDLVTEIGENAFNDCNGLKNITIPNSVTSIGNNAFSGWIGLKKIYIVSEDMRSMILECSLPSKIEIVVVKPATESKPSKTNTYIPPVWKPTEPGDIFRHSLVGTEEVDYTVLDSADSIYMKKEVQGQLFFDAVALIQGDYTLGRTYTIFVNDKLTYKTENKTKIALKIPEALQKEGREFCMFRVSENGAVSSLQDLDADPNTITFETDKFYAFVLGYKDQME